MKKIILFLLFIIVVDCSYAQSLLKLPFRMDFTKINLESFSGDVKFGDLSMTIAIEEGNFVQGNIRVKGVVLAYSYEGSTPELFKVSSSKTEQFFDERGARIVLHTFQILQELTLGNSTKVARGSSWVIIQREGKILSVKWTNPFKSQIMTFYN